MAVGELGRQERERLDRDEADEVELEPAGVLALVGVDDQEAAALEAARLERQADAGGRQEAEPDVERTEVALGEGGVDAQPDALDEEVERPERSGDAGR